VFVPAVLPHLTPEEYAHTRHIVEEFGAGIGKQLHHKLNERNKHARNWVCFYTIFVKSSTR